MGGFAMPTGGATNTMTAPKQGGVQGLGSQLYAGSTNVAGSPMPMPIATQPKQGTGSLAPQPASPGALPVAAKGTAATAPAGLNVSQNPGGATPGGGGTVNNATGTSGSDASRLAAENQNYFGQGVGSALTNYLNSGGGYNSQITQQTVNATDNAMQQQINQQYGDLQTSLSNAGLSPNSSAAALAKSNFTSNASAQENQVAAQQYSQMWSQSSSQYLQALQMVAGVNAQGTANQRTVLGAIGSVATGGLGGLAQYEGGAAGEAGGVTSTTGLFGGSGSSSGSGSMGNDAASLLGLAF